MKLYYAPASPYARKVLVVAHEKGLADRIGLIVRTVSPVDRNAEVAARNPMAKVPTLVLDDGRSVVDSRVIAAYLDRLGPLPRLIPEEGAGRLSAMTLEALADGLLDAAILTRYETVLRPEELRWQAWIDGQTAKIDACVAEIEARWMATLQAPLNIGAIAVGCALGYLDFRFAARPWRERAPRLARWFEAHDARPSMAATRPVG